MRMIKYMYELVYEHFGQSIRQQRIRERSRQRNSASKVNSTMIICRIYSFIPATWKEHQYKCLLGCRRSLVTMASFHVSATVFWINLRDIRSTHTRTHTAHFLSLPFLFLFLCILIAFAIIWFAFVSFIHYHFFFFSCSYTVQIDTHTHACIHAHTRALNFDTQIIISIVYITWLALEQHIHQIRLSLGKYIGITLTLVNFSLSNVCFCDCLQYTIKWIFFPSKSCFNFFRCIEKENCHVFAIIHVVSLSFSH